MSDFFPEVSEYLQKDYLYDNHESNNQALEIIRHAVIGNYPDTIIKDLFKAALLSPFTSGDWTQVPISDESGLHEIKQNIISSNSYKEIRDRLSDAMESCPQSSYIYTLKILCTTALKRAAELEVYPNWENAPITCPFTDQTIDFKCIIDTFYNAINQTESRELILRLTNVIYMCKIYINKDYAKVS
jgi:hypothetical protein